MSRPPLDLDQLPDALAAIDTDAFAVRHADVLDALVEATVAAVTSVGAPVHVTVGVGRPRFSTATPAGAVATLDVALSGPGVPDRTEVTLRAPLVADAGDVPQPVSVTVTGVQVHLEDLPGRAVTWARDALEALVGAIAADRDAAGAAATLVLAGELDTALRHVARSLRRATALADQLLVARAPTPSSRAATRALADGFDGTPAELAALVARLHPDTDGTGRS